MASETERMHILQMIEDSQISAAEGLRLLDALAADAAAGPLPAPAQSAPQADLEYWRRWWLLPMGVGSGVLLVGALLMYAAFQSGGLGFWFACARLAFAAGVLIIALAGRRPPAHRPPVLARPNPAAG